MLPRHLGAQQGSVLLMANRICPQQAQTKTHTALCWVVLMLECFTSSRRNKERRMKRGRWLAEVTARPKPLQTPGPSLAPPTALAFGPAQGWKSRSQVCSPPHWRDNHIPRFPFPFTREAPSHVLPFTSTPGTIAPGMAALQVQLVQQSWENPTSSSSGPWAGQAGKPLPENDKVLRVLRPCPGSSTCTGDRKGLEPLGPLNCLLLRSAPEEVPSPSYKGTFASQETPLQKVHLPGSVLTPLQHLWERGAHQVQSQRNDTHTEALGHWCCPGQSSTGSVGCRCEVPEGSQKSCRGAWDAALALEAHRQWRAHTMIPIRTFLQEQTTLLFEFFLHRCLQLCPRRGWRHD